MLEVRDDCESEDPFDLLESNLAMACGATVWTEVSPATGQLLSTVRDRNSLDPRGVVCPDVST
jgi:hypothetical protein